MDCFATKVKQVPFCSPQGSYCANLGTFPVRYMGSTINGAGMGGLLPSVVNVVILALNANFQQAGFWCFLFAEAMCILCLGESSFS